MSNQIFQTLKKLPIPLDEAQCVLHKYELLICGSCEQRACYSYHKIKNKYKFICDYPSTVALDGHCVVKLVDNNNEITLLSFGSSRDGKNKHTLVMKYISVWSNILAISNKLNKSNEFNNYNQWIPFTDNHNHSIIIGRDNDDYRGVRALIGGSNNHLLFITYRSKNISVFDLNTFQFIKHDTLLTNGTFYHCFVSKLENVQEQEMMKTNKQNYQMLLFCDRAGLSIEYDEDNNIFQFHQLPVCDNIASLFAYAYVCINDVILFFGGWNINNITVSKLVHKYSIRENKWITFENTLPSPLNDCVALLDEEDNNIHIIGGKNDKWTTVSTHMKTKMRIWDYSQLDGLMILIKLLSNIVNEINFEEFIVKYINENYVGILYKIFA
ncbi:hypothetical protein RFI_12059 [Reticulomyxa filosa]|uniref:Kelch motif family protein n=1 Tax=Reticulomyxa filosa TaxID=46433 RepID=X6NGP6_RETFI|nr:hypothetical protein RFI_12059 [Reticulomyxa filosa]|eukprot:ETO25083.1 hypothetical protein RFI_12059 [Reticulomyxa filosa]